ncbi:unnamed protein product [Pleuronectes platessa]|uniref:Uncharacterized protein n=1 Tax=Pleuronectes platessa TaxID=8262 RepID=A0A9N7U7D9_PLEPL|nr:unnamed protein product [Pleuronectes platessa]
MQRAPRGRCKGWNGTRWDQASGRMDRGIVLTSGKDDDQEEGVGEATHSAGRPRATGLASDHPGLRAGGWVQRLDSGLGLKPVLGQLWLEQREMGGRHAHMAYDQGS